jgi:hypothetical protein
VIFPDFDLGGRSQDNVIYFDNVYGASSSSSVEDITNEQLTIYPNPSNDLVNIFVKNYKGITSTAVYNLMGNLVISTENRQVNIKSLARGIYLFKVSYGEKIEVIKVIKA